MRLQSPFAYAVSLPTLGVTVEPGGVVDVDDTVGESLAAQGWAPVKTKAAKAAESQED